MKKIIYTSLFIHLIIVILFIIIVGMLLPNSNIENNIVKIEKNAEIIPNFQEKLENSSNPSSIILSGFFIDKNTIITANHGVNSLESTYKITDKFGKTYDGNLISKDEENDLAILKINGSFDEFSKFKFASEISVGNEVYFINLSGEKIFGKILKLEGNKIYSSLEFQEGNSGSPLFNTKNEILGVNVEVEGERGISVRII